MTKRVVQDVIIGRGVSPVGGTASTNRRANKNAPVPREPSIARPKNGFSKYIRLSYAAVGMILVLIIVGVIYASTPSAIIEITSLKDTVPVLLSAGASKNVQTNNANISYDTVRISDSVSAELQVLSVKEVDRRATGNIVVFNTVTTESTRLVARTRFETPEGVTFRVLDPFIVPGYSIVDGKKVPGTIEVTVHADEPGDKYNVGFSDFTVPGLSGTPLFEGFFARSRTEISGGFSGSVQVVDDEEVEDIRFRATAELSNVVKEKLKSDVPTEKIAYDKGFLFTVSEDLDDTVITTGDNIATLEITVTATAILFNREELSDFIVSSSVVPDHDNAYVDNLDDLIILFTDSSIESVLANEADVSFDVSGDATINWRISEESIQNALRGTTKDINTFQALFSEQFPQIGQAKVSRIRPFWARRFPDNPSRITIVEGAN